MCFWALPARGRAFRCIFFTIPLCYIVKKDAAAITNAIKQLKFGVWSLEFVIKCKLQHIKNL